jgi:glycosyltransferase involved in cell wall biosynthesis
MGIFILYNVFFFLKRAKIISCEKKLAKTFFLVKPSELDEIWFKSRKKFLPIKEVKIIYVGRIRVEKGILSFIDLFRQLDKKFKLKESNPSVDDLLEIKRKQLDLLFKAI